LSTCEASQQELTSPSSTRLFNVSSPHYAPRLLARLQVRGPARTAKEARKQQQKYAAAKEARSMLGAWWGRAGKGVVELYLCQAKVYASPAWQPSCSQHGSIASCCHGRCALFPGIL